MVLLATTGWYAPAPHARPDSMLRNAVLLGSLGWALAAVAGQPVRGEVLALVAAGAALGSRAHRGVLGAWASRRGIALPGRVHRAVVVGHAGAVRQLMTELAFVRRRDLHVSGACLLDHDDPDAPSLPPGLPTEVELDALRSLVAATDADSVVVLPCSHLDAATLRRIGWELEERGTRMLLSPALTGVSVGRAHVSTPGGLVMLNLRPARLRGPARVVKSIWERVAAAFALVALAPVLAALMIAVRLDSPGPAIFRQVRVGKDDRPFEMWKLRTMTTDAEQRRDQLLAHNEVDGNLFKIREDPRVTRTGRLLRRSSLDELPQLVNILRGQMSLVGPRPALPREVADYDHDVRRRLVVKPGLTGLWQVSGRSDLSWEETVRLDQTYVDNWSLRLDLTILLRTVRAVLGRAGAY